MLESSNYGVVCSTEKTEEGELFTYDDSDDYFKMSDRINSLKD